MMFVLIQELRRARHHSRMKAHLFVKSTHFLIMFYNFLVSKNSSITR